MITSKIKFVGSFSNFLAATREIIAAYVKSTSSLNPPVDLNPSMILKSTSIELQFYYSEMTITGKKLCPYNIEQKCNGVIDESIHGNTYYGNISYKIQLPINVNDPHRVETQYLDGVLVVCIPTTDYIEPVVIKHKKSRSKNI